jgi:hypothetical protein
MLRFCGIEIAVQVLYLVDEDGSVWKTKRMALENQFNCTSILRWKPTKSAANTSAPVQYTDLAISASTTAMTITRR